MCKQYWIIFKYIQTYWSSFWAETYIDQFFSFVLKTSVHFDIYRIYRILNLNSYALYEVLSLTYLLKLCSVNWYFDIFDKKRIKEFKGTGDGKYIYNN